MYNAFFDFSEDPFSNTPDPKFYHETATHQKALEDLLHGINRKKGFLVLTGDVGTGKTTMCSTLLKLLGNSVDTALVLNPDLSDIEILQVINRDFGLPYESASKSELMYTLYQFLMDCARENRDVLIVIDDAQNLPTRSLEQVRMISNFETNTQKLVQILLVGQQELNDKMNSWEFRQIKQRIAVHPHLTPLSRKETGEYINHRIQLAGGKPDKISFSSQAVRTIHRLTQGYPRSVNTLCDHSLKAAFERKMNVINKHIVKQESSGIRLRSPLETWLAGKRKVLGWGLAACCAILVSAGSMLVLKASGFSFPSSGTPQDNMLQSKLDTMEKTLLNLETRLIDIGRNDFVTVSDSAGSGDLAENLADAQEQAQQLRLQLKKKETELKSLRQDLLMMEKGESNGGSTLLSNSMHSSLQSKSIKIKDEKILDMERSLGTMRQKIARMEHENKEMSRSARLNEEHPVAQETAQADGGDAMTLEKLRVENHQLKQNQILMEKIAGQTIKAQGNEIERLLKEKEDLSKSLKKADMESNYSPDKGVIKVASP